MSTNNAPAGIADPIVGPGRDQMFVRMLREYRRSGGIIRVAASAAESSWPCDGPLAHPSSHVICFEWSGDLWLPRFQFEGGWTVTAGAARVIAELETVFDGWEMASWFCEANLWIGGARPVDLIASCASSVLGAARADRFIAAG